MDRCSFTGSVGDSLLDLAIYFKVDQLHITNTRIKADVEFNGRVNEDVKLLDNRIEGMVDLTLFRFPETDTRFPFQQFNQASFVMWEKEDGSRITAEDFAKDTEGKKEYFYYWMATFKRLYDVYRKRADLESANICYQKMKELEILYLSKKPTRTFQDGMRLWMNRTMGFYTDHATNPAKALFISFLIILGFSGLYMFFPSDWDKESKSRLINEFKRLREPDAGNVQTRSLWTNFLISVANAFTLSLNAFVTLGFGNIPTSGLARYF
ncbi:MAG: hypothetical protein FJZ78_11100 [Bacteroidetes bacterium]|nr:hypothetical protein [Bacteroidota bacterium]